MSSDQWLSLLLTHQCYIVLIRCIDVGLTILLVLFPFSCKEKSVMVLVFETWCGEGKGWGGIRRTYIGWRTPMILRLTETIRLLLFMLLSLFICKCNFPSVFLIPHHTLTTLSLSLSLSLFLIWIRVCVCVCNRKS
jgi:hypothetical protein